MLGFAAFPPVIEAATAGVSSIPSFEEVAAILDLPLDPTGSEPTAGWISELGGAELEPATAEVGGGAAVEDAEVCCEETGTGAAAFTASISCDSESLFWATGEERG